MTKEESTNTREENMRPSVPESNGVLKEPEDILAENKLTPDEEVRENVRKLAHGHLDNSFLSTDKTLDLLRFGKPILEKVPLGPKDNMFFIIDNSSNSEKRRQNKQSNFLDDCGAWKSGGPTTKFIYHVDQSGKRTKIHLKEGKYCVERRIEKKNVYVPLDIQPKDSELLVLHRQYMTLKAPQQYQRRITWISSFPENEIQRVQEVALYEYRGTFPGGQPHGNCKDVNKIYKKTGTTVLEKIAKLNKVMTGPEAVYRELNQEEDPSQRPRNTKQIKNKKYFESQKENTKNHAGASMYKKI